MSRPPRGFCPIRPNLLKDIEMNARRLRALSIAGCAAAGIALSACGGGGELSIDLPREGEPPPDGVETLPLVFPTGQFVEHPLPFRISGGFPPYTSSIDGCPEWKLLH